MASALSDQQFQRLDAIAQMAKGSWFSERKKGGSGFMGSFVDSQTGETHYIKFAIHHGERKGLSNKDPNTLEFFKKMSGDLATDLIKLAKQVGVDTKVGKLLEGCKADNPSLLTRKLVAKSVSLIADAHNDLRGGDTSVRAFKWSSVRKLQAEDDTSLASVKRDVDIFENKGASKNERSTVERAFSTAGDACSTAKMEEAFAGWGFDRFSLDSPHYEKLKLGLKKGYYPQTAWRNWMPDETKMPLNFEGTYDDYLNEIIKNFVGDNIENTLKQIASAEETRGFGRGQIKKLLDEAIIKAGGKTIEQKQVAQVHQEVKVEENNNQGISWLKNVRIGGVGNNQEPEIVIEPNQDIKKLKLQVKFLDCLLKMPQVEYGEGYSWEEDSLQALNETQQTLMQYQSDIKDNPNDGQHVKDKSKIEDKIRELRKQIDESSQQDDKLKLQEKLQYYEDKLEVVENASTIVDFWRKHSGDVYSNVSKLKDAIKKHIV